MSTPGEKYLPSNGTEGCGFFAVWCEHCARDAHMNSGKDFDACEPHEICDIIAAAFRGPVDEWAYGEDGNPRCTAFVPVGEKVPVIDLLTLDMFA